MLYLLPTVQSLQFIMNCWATWNWVTVHHNLEGTLDLGGWGWYYTRVNKRHKPKHGSPILCANCKAFDLTSNISQNPLLCCWRKQNVRTLPLQWLCVVVQKIGLSTHCKKSATLNMKLLHQCQNFNQIKFTRTAFQKIIPQNDNPQTFRKNIVVSFKDTLVLFKIKHICVRGACRIFFSGLVGRPGWDKI